MKEGEGIKEYICRVQGQGQQCGDGQREEGGGWERFAKVGKVETSVIVSTINIKINKIKSTHYIHALSE